MNMDNHKCELCPVTKEDMNIFKDYGKNKHTAVSWDIEHDYIKSHFPPDLVGKITFDPAEDKVSIVFNREVENNNDYCYEPKLSGELIFNPDDIKICRYYRDSKCILTGCDIVNMVRPCSCKEKKV
jgi:hypothetical protein